MRIPIDVSITDFWIDDFGKLVVEISVDVDGKVTTCIKEVSNLK